MLEIDNIKDISSFMSHIKSFNKKIAIIYRNKHYTYQSLYNSSHAIANWFKVKNYKSIMFATKNSPLTMSLYLGAWLSNTRNYAIGPRLLGQEILRIMENISIDALIIEKKQLSLDLKRYCLERNIKIYTLISHTIFLGSIITKYRKKCLIFSNNDGNTITYHMSSGTEKKPCFYGHTLSQILNYTYRRQFDLGLFTKDITLVALSINHAYAFSYQFLISLALGITMVLFCSFQEEKIIEAIKNYSVTSIALLPIMYDRLCNYLEGYKNFFVHNLRYLSVAGDQPSYFLMKKVYRIFQKPLLNGIGMTEVYGYGQNLCFQRQLNKINYFKDFSIKLKPINLFLAKYGSIAIDKRFIPFLINRNIDVGEIILRSDMIPCNYSSTSLNTGDIAYIDSSRNLYFLGRNKFIIVKGGSKISPLEIEFYLSQIPSLPQIIIVGKKDKVWGQLVCACVLNSQKEITSLNFLNSYLLKFVAPYKKIDKIFFMEDFPLTSSGKVDRLSLSLLV